MSNDSTITMEESKTIEFGDAEDENEGMVSKKKHSKRSGGFQAMGLTPAVLKAILKRGYKIPTPIQRKTIPIALEGRDLVAMARTGSGKTACFLIPLLEKLKSRNAKSGARALILSPTRELALQTLKFMKELGKFTGLKAAVILGGDSMDNQFSLIHGNPDVIVATPGRFLHLCVEMDLTLKSVEFVVFDEADRLFEMGWGEQIHEITNRLPENRQTLLFSATLPKVLVEFSKAGLCDPILIRLDVESKLPEQLTLSFIACRKEEKLPVLLCLLKYIIKEESQVVVFAPTQHHVDYIHMILDHANITNTFIYSSLDSAARKINAAKFRTGKTKVLIVTDVAARGLDIPHLDNVINYNFPAKSKLFVHRVGRCARAGRSGTAYNIVANDEYPYLLDLHLFLGLKLNILPNDGTGKFTSGAIGKIPAAMIEQELGELKCWHETSTDLRNMENVCRNAYQQYLRSRPGATVDSIRKAKELEIANAGVISQYNKEEIIIPGVNDLLAKIKKYRPAGTIFEIGMKPSSIDYKVMKTKREFHRDKIRNFQVKQIERKENFVAINSRTKSTLDNSNADDIAATFSKVVTDRKRRLDDLYREPRKKKKKKKMVDDDNVKDSEFYIPYSAGDKHTEEGLAVNNFASAAEKEQMDLTGDTEESRRLQGQIKKWDRKKKKMITINNNSKTGKIRTESGAWIPATYKTDRYKQWKEKSKIDHRANDDSDNEEPEDLRKLKSTPNTHWARHNQKLKEKIKMKHELKTPEQILKKRKLDEKKRNKNARKGKGKSGKKARR